METFRESNAHQCYYEPYFFNKNIHSSYCIFILNVSKMKNSLTFSMDRSLNNEV